MKDLQIFNSPDFGEIRTVLSPSNEPMFCLADVCKALDLSNPSQVKTRMKDPYLITNEVSIVTGKKADGTLAVQMKEMTFIGEPNLYRCIFQSRKPEAEKFQDWIFNEVLPELRKTGGYMVSREEESEEDLMARALQVANRTMERLKTRNQILESQKQVLIEEKEQLQPLADYTEEVLQSKSTHTMTQVAKEFGYSAQTFSKKLKDAGVLFRRSSGERWLLTSKYQSHGYTEVRTSTFTHKDGTIGTSSITVWTEKGRMFLHAFKKGQVNSKGKIINLNK
jgi:prophage antirepressor-like protein